MSDKTIKKMHNPKSFAPAVYIPCWLIQIPNNLLSFAAKCLYGRLSQWCNESGDVFRSYNQLAEEIGSTKRSINEYLRELRDCGLIGTLQPQAGGLNHFVFYDHEWMHTPINKNLVYKSDTNDPEQNPALPRAESCSTPEQNPARINKKEIKQIKNTISDLKKSQEKNKSIPIEQMIDVYHELLPECPKVKIVGTDLERQLKTLQQRWPEISANKEQFSLDGFRKFILFIKEKFTFLITPYETEHGKIKQGGLKRITQFNIIAKCLNGEFSSNK